MVEKIKCIIGCVINRIGACLWQNGGWTGTDERYEDLKMTGKLGYKMFCTGFKLMGITPDEIDEIIDILNHH